MSDRDVIGIRIKGFKFLAFAFKQQENIDAKESFNFEIATNIEINQSQLNVKVFVRVIRVSVNKEVAKAETATLFTVDGSEHFLSGDGNVKYPDGFLVTPVSLAISTTRGAILAKGAGSFLENIPLPIVVPKTFVPASDDRVENEDH